MSIKPNIVRTLAILILLAVALGAPGGSLAHALQTIPEGSLPEGLHSQDWSQIKSLLPPDQQAYLKASNTGSGDDFGYSVAVDGDTLVIGADYESSNATGVDGDGTNNSANSSGAAYVFVRSGTTWSQQAYLKASNTELGDSFGYSVAISGDTIVVGAPNEDSADTGVNGDQDDNTASGSGAAYVFTRSGTVWSQQAYLKASNTEEADCFGISVAISGDTIVIGAPMEASSSTGVNGNQSDNLAYGSGAAYVFTRDGTAWNQQAYLKASNTEERDYFGMSVAIVVDTLVVGARGEDSSATQVNGDQDDNSASGSGAAYVFTRDGTAWNQQAYLKASNTGSGDNFGYPVAVDGDTVVAGAISESSSATGVDGNQEDNSAAESGAAYVFTRSGTTWSQQAYLKASNTDLYDYFGYAVSVNGDTVVVGAISEDSNAAGVNGDDGNNSAIDSGAAYVFTRNGTTWSQAAYLKASNTGMSDRFGGSLSISGDTVVIGATYEDSNATGVNGDQGDNSAFNSGAAYVFHQKYPPTDISLSNSSVAENQPIGTTIGTFTTTDPNAGDTHTYSLACTVSGADDASFTVVDDALNTNAIFNYETKNSYDLCIRTDDGNGGTYDKDFTISVTDVIETITATFRSAGIHDGWILETTETSNVGGTLDRTSPTFILGDGAQDKQYRAILSFNTGGLPDNAVITKVTLKIRRQGVLGTDPFTILGRLMVDIRKPFFGKFYGLEARDFQAAASKNAVALFGATPINYWYSANLNATGRAYVNKTGVTQFRLRFYTDDNDNNVADYMRFCSGNYATVAARPTLVVEYYEP